MRRIISVGTEAQEQIKVPNAGSFMVDLCVKRKLMKGISDLNLNFQNETFKKYSICIILMYYIRNKDIVHDISRFYQVYNKRKNEKNIKRYW